MRCFQDVNPPPKKEPLQESKVHPQELSNGETDISKLKITDEKSEMENVPISSDAAAPTPTMEEVI